MILQPVWKYMRNLESKDTSPSFLPQKLNELRDFEHGIWKKAVFEKMDF